MASVLDRYSIADLRRIARDARMPDELFTYRDLLQADLAGLDERAAAEMRDSPDRMAAYLTRGRIRRWAYVRLLGQKFADAVEGRSKRQIWNLPARYGKSLFASRWGPVWLLDRRPEANMILASYAYNLARENAVWVRDRLQEHAETLGARLVPDRRRADRFNTDAGGGVLAAGIDGQITGFGAGTGGGIVIDDPYKNWQEAHSEKRREHVWNQYRSVLRTRLDDEDAWIIVVHTRWHEDDLTGRLLDGDEDDWELVRLPALAEQHDPKSNDVYLRMADPLGRAAGEPLEPERFSLPYIQTLHLTLGSYLAAALEQQRPAPEEGGEIKRAWWQWSSNPPTKKADAWCTSWDMKLKEKQAGDYVVGQVWARTGADYWCVDQMRGQWNMPTVRCALALTAVRWPHVTAHYVENTGNGPEVIELVNQPSPGYVVSDEIAGMLGMTADERDAVNLVVRRGLSGVLPVNPVGSKVARARAVAPFIEAGNVHLPEGAPWAPLLVGECAAFPNGAHDDQVDAMSQALAILGNLPRRRGEARPQGGSQASAWKTV